MTETILGGVVIAIVSAVAGNIVGNKNGVKQATCIERQHACKELVTTKIDALCSKVDDLANAIRSLKI